MYAHKGGTKKLKRHGLHGFALDQPSIHGSGPINRSEKMKRSETVGNGRKHDQAKTCSTRIFLKISISAQRRFFWRSKRVQGETVGNSRRLHLRSAKKHVFTQFSKMFHEHMLQNNYFFAERRCDLRLFPTVSPWTPLDLQKKRRCAEMLIFKKKMRVEQVLGWSCFRPFPTVSDCFRPFPAVSFFLND